MPHDEFGPFASAFERGELDVPGYLELLHLGRMDGVRVVVERIASALSQGDSQRWVRAMMGQRNWRPHLVGAVAFLLDHERVLDRGDLWAAIDGGSWVTPQLAVTASFADPSFADGVRSRLDAYCPLTSPESARPASPDRSGKMAASLLGVASRTPDLRPWVPGWRSDPQIQELLEQDAAWDGSEHITTRWADDVSACFHALGIELARR
jgi:hypothetical protein